MTLSIRRTGSQDYGRFMKVLVCGEPGAGKTLISSTFPNPFYASAEGGLMSVADRNLPYSTIRTSDELLAVKTIMDQPADLRRSALGFDVDTVVIDTIDEIQKILMRERIAKTKKESMSLPDWGWLGEQMQAIIRGFRNLDMNVIFTCHLKESRDDELGRLYYEPGLQGQIGASIAGYVDLALVLKSSSKTEVQDGQAVRVVQRFVQTAPDSQFAWLKDRSGKLPPEVPVNFEDDYKRLEQFIFGGIELDEGSTSTAEVPVLDLKAPPEVSATEVTPVVAEEDAQEVLTDGQESLVLKNEVFEMGNEEAVAVIETSTISEETTGSTSESETSKKAAEVFTCEADGCGAEVNEDQKDLSRIRFRKVLCREHFTAAKRK